TSIGCDITYDPASAMIPIGPEVKAGEGLLGSLLEKLLVRLGLREAAPVANVVTREVLEAAAESTGPVVRVVTKLDGPPSLGRALSVATGDEAEALANAARESGEVFRADIPKDLIETLKTAGLVEERTTLMQGAKGGEVTGKELYFKPEAAEFI